MHPGYRIGDRFEIESKAGTGGMGTVFRARDEQTGEPVAVKVLHQALAAEMDRFSREVQVLAELSQTFDERGALTGLGPAPKYPAIVRYVAHGMTEFGAPYLVMEWLEGQSLDKRLRQARLTLYESVALASRVAKALSLLHAVGVVHRDIKPSNLFLCGGHIDTVKLIDFGIARPRRTAREMTRTGTAMGTPGYMAPEQVRGEPDVGAPADVFSLGCVLFECLTGRPAFEGEHVMAVLAKLLLDEAPPLRELCPGIPEDLEALVWRMLAKDPLARPEDGTALLEQLSTLVGVGVQLGVFYDASSPTGQFIRIRRSIARPPAVLTSGEQRIVSVLLVAAEPERNDDAGQQDAASGPSEDAPTALPISGFRKTSEVDQALHNVVAEHGTVLDRLADGTRLLALAGGGVATDQAAQAAQCALSMRKVLPHAAMALATGRGRVGGQRFIGEVIDRAAQMLNRARTEATADTAGTSPIVIDELTAGLLKTRFQIESAGDRRLLRTERDPMGTAALVLGKPSSCVGRDRELLMLQATLDDCISDSSSRAILVMGRAGIGKSRLCHEFVQRTSERDEPVEIWVARGDPMQAGAPLGLLGQIIRRQARLVEGEPLEARCRKLRTRVARHVAPSIVTRVAEFLGEIAGAPFPGEQSAQLTAARQDALLRSDQMRRAWIDFIDAECRAHPVMLILEELQWGDRSTVEYVDAALRVLREQPLMVLALARPEVTDLFPKLWADRDVQQMRLGELSRKACEKLSRAVLGSKATPETLAKLWERSGGNAFFLEELLRAMEDGREDDVPETVLAMVQSRLSGLSPDARRLLRAGSIFGQVFWIGAVAELLGEGHRRQALDARITTLEEREWIFERPEPTFQGEREYAFRHALVRDAAYGMLTDDDRVLGHRLAGEWLARAGEWNATVVAAHFETGGALERAVEWYRRAAEQALGGDDLAAAIERVERAIACGASGETLGELNCIRAEAHRWRGEYAAAECWGLEAARALPTGSASWYAALHEASSAAGKLSHRRQLTAIAEMLTQAGADREVTAPELITTARLVISLLYAGLYPQAAALDARIEEASYRFHHDPMASATLLAKRAVRAHFEGDVRAHRELSQEALDRFERADDMRSACWQRVHRGYACSVMGAYAEGAELLRAALSRAEAMGLYNVAASAKQHLGFALARLGALDEARTVQEEAVEVFREQGDRRASGLGCINLTEIRMAAGDLRGAEIEAWRAVELLTDIEPLLPYALAMLAAVLIASGHPAEAFEHALEAVNILEWLSSVEEGESFIRLTYAESLAAIGDQEEAREAIVAANERLAARAAAIADPAWRSSFLHHVPEHARTIQLATEWDA